MADWSTLQPRCAGKHCAVVIITRAGSGRRVQRVGQIAIGARCQRREVTSATSSAVRTRSPTAGRCNPAGRAYLHFFAIESVPRVRMVPVPSNDKRVAVTSPVSQDALCRRPDQPPFEDSPRTTNPRALAPGAGACTTAPRPLQPRRRPGEQAMNVDYISSRPTAPSTGPAHRGPIEILKLKAFPNFVRYTLRRQPHHYLQLRQVPEPALTHQQSVANDRRLNCVSYRRLRTATS